MGKDVREPWRKSNAGRHTIHLRHGVGGDLDNEATQLSDGRVVLRTDADAGGDLGEGFWIWNTLCEHPDIEGVGRAVVSGGAAYYVVLSRKVKVSSYGTKAERTFSIP